MSEKKPFERLPKDVVPTNYKLELQPDLEKYTFSGNVVITVQPAETGKWVFFIQNTHSLDWNKFDMPCISSTKGVKYATTQITTNSVDIQVSKAVFKSDGKDFESSDISYKKEDEKVTFTFASALPVGEGQLHLDFTGELNDKMKGFYRSNYTTPSGEKRVCAVTQFEATDARRAFPCWDEPAIKATFDVTLVVPKDRVALSNMNVIKEEPNADNANLKVVTYAQTPIMSTYLLAFIVGEFNYVEGKSSDGVLVRVYTPLGRQEQGEFALEVAIKTLPFYKNYFNIGFPLPKIDLIAIPDFAAGAMENWGLVTYRETALLVDPKHSSAASKQWVALVVGHELAHQWFGNLVTMEWWTHLWLNEGFASWIEYLCVDHCFPEYDIWTQFMTTDYTRALNLDALSTSHPIEVPVGHPDEVDEIFDLISYCKGSSVIRMLHDFIGDEAFRKGMEAYLTEHKYKNTQTEDLWRALGKASGQPIEQIMGSWTKQMGFPVIEVSGVQEGNARKLTIKQSKFCADGPISGESPQWMVPISVSTSSKPNEAVTKVVLDKPSMTITVDNVKPDEWVKLNPLTMGFYRVKYSSEMLDALLPGITNKQMHARDRLGLESDLFALAKAGQASTIDVLKVIEAFQNETHCTVWQEIANNLGTLGNLLSNTDYKDLYKAFLKKLFTAVYDHVSWDPKEGEGHLTALLRGLVVRTMGNNGHPHAVEEARKRFKAHCSGGDQIHADLRAPIYVTVLANGDEQTFEEMLKYFRTQELHEEKERILRSLGAIRDPTLIQKVLDFSLTDEVRSQDTVFVIGGVTGHKLGKELAWKFVQDKWSVLHERYSGGFLLSRLVQSTTEGFATEERAQEVEAFFKEHKAPAAERTIKQSLENIRLNKAWLERDSQSIHEWLKTKAD